MNFYPRSPCGERQRANRLANAPPHISIHALLAESDLGGMSDKLIGSVFLSTLSLRRATHFGFLWSSRLRKFLSTLSLRRATAAKNGSTRSNRNFYPRSPCGERRYVLMRYRISARYFYPRSPCGERRLLLSVVLSLRGISIHALLAESDLSRV